MKQSQLFTRATKEIPAGEQAKNAQLLIRSGYVHKDMAGVYSYLPLGLRVLNNVMQIIREEMNAIGGQELFLTALQGQDVWQTTDRWSDEASDVWFRTELKNGTKLGLGWTHEEPITNLMKNHIRSYRDLPAAAYQFQTKFRNELRAKSGIMRSREFIMKDLYSFSLNKDQHDAFYEESKQAYLNVFDRCGIGEKTYVTFASGGAFSKYSHEFQTETDAGEDTIYIDEEKRIAVNEEVMHDEVLEQLGLSRDTLRETKAVEVGNIFTLGTRFSEPLDLKYIDENGEPQFVFMGSYGIGPGRLMGTIAELLSDERGLVWPKSVAPFAVHLVSLESKDETIQARIENTSEELYTNLIQSGIEVLWDDRNGISPGARFGESDLLGIPLRIVISEKTLTEDSAEWKERSEKEMRLVKLENIKQEIENWNKE